ncbi:hypothetical protein WJX73_000265 [Symbiochloris irregularis]|uniref:Non-haem dioxygenase N-terminal domain-containing protein n=1 Tax=Symbiochloris irregularis TaxID=706552 RepID=A0AAW1NZ78_9CHLO
MACRPPIVDLSDFDRRRSEIQKQLMDAAQGTGFFYISGHGIVQSLIDEAYGQADSFFQLPHDAKDRLPKVDWAACKVRGYELNNLTDGTLHESMMQAFDVHEDMEGAWPPESMLPDYRATTVAFMQAMHPVAQRILSCFATGLGFSPDFFEKMTDISSPENHTFLQYHKYPSTEGLKWKPGTNRITAHTDESLITLLHIGPGSMLSDGLLKSNYHRVRMPLPGEPQGDRYSMGYFVWPALHDKLQGKSGKTSATTMAEYMKQKGKIFSYSFSPDIDTYEKSQQYAFGPPQIESAA